MNRSVLLLMLVMVLTFIPAHAESSNITYIDIFSANHGSINGLVFHDGMLVATTDLNKYFAIDPFSDYRNTIRSLPSEWIEAEGSRLSGQWGVIPGDDGMYMVSYNMTIDDEDLEVTDTLVILRRLSLSSSGKLQSEAEWELDFEPVADALGDFTINAVLANACVANGRLAATVDDMNRSYLAVFEIEDGDCELIDSSAALHGLYKDGTVLMSETSHASSDPEITFSAFDPETCDSEPIFTYQAVSMGSYDYITYSPDDDALFFLTGSMLTRITGMDPDTAETICPVSTNMSFMPLAIAPDRDTYITASGASVMLYDASKIISGTTLAICDHYGLYNSQTAAQQAFNRLHPDVTISQESVPDIIQAMVSRSSDADIFILPSYDNAYNVLMDRGYLTSLDDVAGLPEYISRMYPFIQDFVTKDGHICALPVYFSAGTHLSYSTLAMEDLGLTASELPTTWIGLFRFMQEKPALFEENGVISMFPLKRSISEIRDYLFDRMMDDYMQYIVSTGQALTFDTPLLRSLLAEFEKIDFYSLGLTEEGDAPAYTGYIKDTLFWESANNISPDQYNLPEYNALSPVILALSDDTAPAIYADMAVAVINPYSENKELALEYISQLMLNATPSLITSICPDADDPILASDYDELLAIRQENVVKIEAELEKAPEDEKEEWERNLAVARDYLEKTLNYEDKFCWDISPQSLVWYRSMDGMLAVRTSVSLNADAHSVIRTQFDQYLDGLITADEMINTIDERITMMLLESQ